MTKKKPIVEPTAKLVEALAENKRLRDAIEKVYPSVAGRVIALQQLGEEKAAQEWNEVARTLYAALAAKD